MKANMTVAPTSECLSLAEAKRHMRIDSETFAGNLTTVQSLPPASYAIANNYTTHVGTAVNVLGLNAIVNLIVGSVVVLLDNGTIDCKIQESDDSATWNDWTGGAFAQVTSTTDFATYEIAYTGSKKYIRTVAKVLVAACSFSTAITTETALSAEDTEIELFIQAAEK